MGGPPIRQLVVLLLRRWLPLIPLTSSANVGRKPAPGAKKAGQRARDQARHHQLEGDNACRGRPRRAVLSYCPSVTLMRVCTSNTCVPMQEALLLGSGGTGHTDQYKNPVSCAEEPVPWSAPWYCGVTCNEPTLAPLPPVGIPETGKCRGGLSPP